MAAVAKMPSVKKVIADGSVIRGILPLLIKAILPSVIRAILPRVV